MSTSGFDIIFRGDIVFGHQLAEVKANLQQLFKVDAAKIDGLFTGRPVPLKRNLDQATANKYRDVLVKAGAIVEVCPSDAGAVQAVPKAPPAARPTAASAPSAPAQWSLAPVGADLLSAQERPAPAAPVRVDISGMSLRAAQGNLVDRDEVPTAIGAAVAVPDLVVAAPGADLLRGDEKLDLPLVEVTVEDWGLADVGSVLLREDERPTASLAIVAVGDYGLAPAGSDLGQLKPQVKPVTPDISQLQLADAQ